MIYYYRLKRLAIPISDQRSITMKVIHDVDVVLKAKERLVQHLNETLNLLLEADEEEVGAVKQEFMAHFYPGLRDLDKNQAANLVHFDETFAAMTANHPAEWTAVVNLLVKRALIH